MDLTACLKASRLRQRIQELRTIQQYGLTLRPEDDLRGLTSRPFSEEEIDYALSLVDTLELNRTQLTTLLRVDTNAFEDMVSTVTVAVENSLNTTIREGQVSQSIMTIQQIVGYKLDVSLTQNIIPTVLRTCIKPNMIIDAVPARTELWRPHDWHSHSLLRWMCHASRPSQTGHVKPFPHRIHSKYARQSSSVGNQSRNSSKVPGYGCSLVAFMPWIVSPFQT